MLTPILRDHLLPLELVELELDPPKAGEVSIRMAASGVCHSCLHVMDGSLRGAPMPIVLGDEGAGVVEEVGPGVDHVRVGKTIEFDLAGADRSAAETEVKAMCERLLANTVIESYRVEIA